MTCGILVLLAYSLGAAQIIIFHKILEK